MFQLSLALIFLHLTSIVCHYEFNYTVYDTIGTEVFANTTTEILIYKTNQQDCYLFIFENGSLRFKIDYDFNQQFNKLDFSCKFVANFSFVLYFYVRVIDTNDHAPVFHRTSYQLSVDEQFGTTFRTVEIPLPFATDPDYFPFDIRGYDLTGDIINFEYFTFVREDLTLVNKKVIDRENRYSFFFNISATDGGTPPRTSPVIPITLTVYDLNDNSPQFLPHQKYFSFPEDEPPGLSIGQFSAYDIDIGSNSRIKYLLSALRAFKDDKELDNDEFNSPFFINVSSSEVFLSGELDFETYDRLRFTIEAIDFGQTPRFNTSVIIVTVTDVFDTPPQLRITSFIDGVLHINENTRAKVISPILFRPELPANATANLNLISSYDKLFSVHLDDTHEWSLQRNGDLDRESQDIYEIYFLLEITTTTSPLKHI